MTMEAGTQPFMLGTSLWRSTLRIFAVNPGGAVSMEKISAFLQNSPTGKAACQGSKLLFFRKVSTPPVSSTWLVMIFCLQSTFPL